MADAQQGEVLEVSTFPLPPHFYKLYAAQQGAKFGAAGPPPPPQTPTSGTLQVFGGPLVLVSVWTCTPEGLGSMHQRHGQRYGAECYPLPLLIASAPPPPCRMSLW